MINVNFRKFDVGRPIPLFHSDYGEGVVVISSGTPIKLLYFMDAMRDLKRLNPNLLVSGFQLLEKREGDEVEFTDLIINFEEKILLNGINYDGADEFHLLFV